ncbi:AAA family ATPase [Asticcacaulis sp. DXS10W]|uniref:AAA family ATPase n=1 Tax=Asticcacaulis currens TaxID=2984210 RepID=A0ABT5ICE4_9CAUL|nr:AAA family ATPase [Asticcacaulis currens]MDC7693859.1 AAA family ATPase [Asticcacaulis currens]
MLYKIELENFYSIREAQVLDLSVSPSLEDTRGRFAAIFPGSTIRTPKVVAIYGANASGKTTILRALHFLSSFISSVNVESTDFRQPVYTFNDEESRGKPIRLAIELGGITNPQRDEVDDFKPEFGTLRYELVLRAKDGKIERVLWEAMRQRPNGTGRWQRVFERTAEGDTISVKDSDVFPMVGLKHLLKTLRPDASLISTYAYFNHPTAGFYRETASRVSSNVDRRWDFISGDNALLGFIGQQPELLKRLNRDLSRIDVGIEELRIEHIPHLGPQGRFLHSGLHEEMPWELESRGTQAFVRLFPQLAFVFDKGGVALVDEFDTLIHPLVLPEILRWFYDNETRNPLDAQMWLTCHSATMLEDLVKEEVVIAEKDSAGRTRIYSLMDFKALRRDDNLYKKYLGGAYGGIPVIG